MNFKQKLVYMLIGCLFTLAGYFLASLGGSVSQTNNAHPQQNEKQVIDKIVCRELTVVDENGTPIASLKPNKDPKGGFFIGGALKFYSIEGNETVRLQGWPSGHLFLNSSEGKEDVSLGTGGHLFLSNQEGKTTVYLTGTSHGELLLRNREGKLTVDLDGSHLFKGGGITTYDKHGDHTGRLPR